MPYCVATKELILEVPGLMGHSVTPLAPSWLFVFFWWSPWQWIEVLFVSVTTGCL